MAERLTIELIYPLGRAVGRNDDERLVLIVSLGYGRCQVEQRRAAGDTHHYRLVGGLRYAKGKETCGTLVGDGIARDVGALIEVVHDGRVAAAGTNNGVTDAVGYEQAGEDVD